MRYDEYLTAAEIKLISALKGQNRMENEQNILSSYQKYAYLRIWNTRC